MATETKDGDKAWDWLGPRHAASPAEALARIEAACRLHAELPDAAFVVLGTHMGLPREVLAAALKQYRRDLDAFSVQDVTGMLNALLHGGRQGFEAVMRTRKSAPRQGAALPWGRVDD